MLALSASAGARETFPGVIVDKYGGSKKGELLCPPPCTICHDTPAGGTGTANMPFGGAILAGAPALTGNPQAADLTPEQFATTLENLERDPCPDDQNKGCMLVNGVCTGRCDSDGNGTTDIAALKTGKNPNDGKKLFCVTYGCGGARIAPKPQGRSVDGTFALALFGALVVLARRLRSA
jgi:hypothetical protein